MGCEKDVPCDDGKSCIADNTCPTGCSFAECLQRAKLVNANGFSFRSTRFVDPFCKICTEQKLENSQSDDNSGIYVKKGKQ